MEEGKSELKTASGYKKLSSNCLVLWRKLWFVEEGKRGELWIVEKGKKGKFHLCGERQGGQGSVLVIGALPRARLCCSFIGLCL